MRRSGLLLLICAGGGVCAQDDLDAEIDAALTRARPALVRDLSRTRGDVLSLVCLAARHDGMGSGDAAFAAAVERLSSTLMSSTYALAIRLMLLADYPEFPDRERIARQDTIALLDRRGGGGGFSYGSADGWWDLSNTQYAALGLRAAAHLGQTVPEEVWRAMLEEVMGGQKRDGGFSYRPDQGRTSAYSSMTVAGIGVLEICRQHVELHPETEARVQTAIDDGWAWMEEHGEDIGKRGVQSALYFHYGLERAAILSQRDAVGDIDWYRTGAAMILKLQKRSGGFLSKRETRPRFASEASRGNPIDTAFAVLFLRRSFRRVLDGPSTPGPGYLSHGLPAQATEAQIETAVALDLRRGMRAVPDLLKAMRSPYATRRTAASIALHKISGQSFGYHPKRGIEENADSLKRAERWWLARKRDGE